VRTACNSMTRELLHGATERLTAIAAAAELIKAESFTIDGEATVPGPDGLSRFDELSRREAARTAILYAFDLIELARSTF
jgi:ATP-dependent DNA ligase